MIWYCKKLISMQKSFNFIRNLVTLQSQVRQQFFVWAGIRILIVHADHLHRGRMFGCQQFGDTAAQSPGQVAFLNGHNFSGLDGGF